MRLVEDHSARKSTPLNVALIPPNIVPSFRSKDLRIHRVFKDVRSTVNKYFQ
jgi:hypothetical protein